MTVISIMDRSGWDQCTDNIIVADPDGRILTWVPRDLWCPIIKDRINRAFAVGGHDCLISSLQNIGFNVDKSMCLMPSALARTFDKLTITVPVESKMQFIYPLTRESDTEDGHRLVEFNPPFERLEKDRIHEWLGARKSADGVPRGDLERIARQQVFVRAFLDGGFRFEIPPPWQSLMRFNPSAVEGCKLGMLAAIIFSADWKMKTYGDGQLKNAMIEGKCVLTL